MNQSKTYNIPGRIHSIGSEGIVAGADEILDDELNLKQNEINAITGTHIANDEIHVTAAEKEYWNSKVNPPSYSAPTAKQLTYTGEAQDLLNPGSSTSGSIQYSTDETNWSTTVPQGTNAGTYTVYWRFVGSEMVYVDSTEITVTIAKANPTYTAPTAKTLTYNGNAQDLVNAGTTSGGTILYSEDNENWSNSVPSKTNAGNYTVYWKLTGDSNHNSVASTAISVSITKVTPTVTAPTAKSGLAYTGSAQELVNAGSADFGTLQYSSDNENWSTSIPSGTNAGDYSVYYKVVGDSNINDVAAQSVSCSISKADRSVTISDNSTTLELGATNTITVTTEGSPTITVTSSNTSVATVSGMTVTAAGKGTTTITVTVAGDSNYNEYTYSYTLTVTGPMHNGHEYVDLGLPSGTKWAIMNVGANSETDYGNYYMYGKGSRTYNSSDSIYSGTGNPLPTSADTAAQVWGGNWHMPTLAQLNELITNTTYEWITINGVNGGKFIANDGSGNYIFIPAAGFWNNGSHVDEGSYGFVWSSSPEDYEHAYYLGFYSGDNYVYLYGCKRGYSVRPVLG